MITVYLLHLDRPLSPDHTAQHYIGWAEEDKFLERLAKHRAGNGSRFMQVAKERGIGWHLVRIWTGDRGREREIKNKKCAPRLCPICSVKRYHEVPF